MSENDNTLILVHCIMRHGHRTPDKMASYPTDPHRFDNFHPYGKGMLTNQGKAAMYATGKFLRERYNDFLGELYFPEIIDTWATEYERCRSSAELALAGLFPPKGVQKWSEKLNWQPIKVNYKPIDEDEMMASLIRNPKYLKMHARNFETGYGKELIERYADIIAYLEEHTGTKIPTTRQFYLVRDNLLRLEENGYELPDWAKKLDWKKMAEIAYHDYTMETYDKGLRRIVSGLLLKKILTDSVDKIDRKSEKRMCLYCGHDVTIANLLTILGSMYEHFPEYAAVLVLELHRIGDKYGLKLFYKRDVDSDFEARNFGGGNPILWLDEYEGIVKDIWTDDETTTET